MTTTGDVGWVVLDPVMGWHTDRPVPGRFAAFQLEDPMWMSVDGGTLVA